MDAPTIKIVVVPDLKVLDGILADMADAVETIRAAAEKGFVPSDALLDPMLSLLCRARFIVLEDIDLLEKRLLEKAPS